MMVTGCDTFFGPGGLNLAMMLFCGKACGTCSTDRRHEEGALRTVSSSAHFKGVSHLENLVKQPSLTFNAGLTRIEPVVESSKLVEEF